MSLRRLFLSVLLLALAPSAVRAQSFPFEVYSLKEGLPQSQITCLIQDKEDYVGRYGGDEFLIVLADSLLYQAKKAGKHGYIIKPDGDPQPSAELSPAGSSILTWASRRGRGVPFLKTG